MCKDSAAQVHGIIHHNTCMYTPCGHEYSLTLFQLLLDFLHSKRHSCKRLGFKDTASTKDLNIGLVVASGAEKSNKAKQGHPWGW